MHAWRTGMSGMPQRVRAHAPFPGSLRCVGYVAMTLREMSACYRAAAQPIRARLRELRIEMKTEHDPERMFWLKRRTAVLTEMLRQMNELAELTEHYYERGYYRNEKYRI